MNQTDPHSSHTVVVMHGDQTGEELHCYKLLSICTVSIVANAYWPRVNLLFRPKKAIS